MQINLTRIYVSMFNRFFITTKFIACVIVNYKLY